MKLTWQILFRVHLGVLFVRLASSMREKSCLDPAVSYDHSSNCTLPELSTTFCHGPACKTTDTCGILTHALLVQHRDVDVVLISAKTCQGPLRDGPLYLQQPLNRTILNEPLMIVQLDGHSLMAVLEHGLELRHVQKREDAFPRVSGMRFMVNPKRNRTRISKPTILSRSCRWMPVLPKNMYQVLTIPSMLKQARSVLAHQQLLPLELPNDVLSSFEAYAQTECTIRDPFIPQRSQQRTERGRTILRLPTACPFSNNVTRIGGSHRQFQSSI